MSESEHRALVRRIRDHCRPSGAADNAATPRGDEIVRAAAVAGTTAVVVSVRKYGRTEERGTVRTVVLADNGNEYDLVSETVSPPSPETRAFVSDHDDDAAYNEVHEHFARELKHVRAEMNVVGGQVEALERALDEANERYNALVAREGKLQGYES